MSVHIAYCKSCFRELPAGTALCSACESQHQSGAGQKVAIILGLFAIPMLVSGLGGLNAKACIIGALIATGAVVLYVGLSFRS